MLKRRIRHYGYSRDRAPVAELLEAAPDPAARPYLPSIHLTWRCVNVHCRHWTMNGAWLTGRCNFCFTPRPE